MTYRQIRNIHLWLSVPFGLVITITCLTGALLALLDNDDAARATVFKLHRWIMDVPAGKGAMSPGKLIVGISTLCCIGIIITGIMLWWHRAKANLRRSLSIRWHNGFHAWADSFHTAGGITVSLLLLAMALTGLTWSFGWYRDGFYALFGGSDPSAIRPVVRAIHTGALGSNIFSWMWCIAAATGALLPLTGYYLWIKRLINHHK